MCDQTRKPLYLFAGLQSSGNEVLRLIFDGAWQRNLSCFPSGRKLLTDLSIDTCHHTVVGPAAPLNLKDELRSIWSTNCNHPRTEVLTCRQYQAGFHQAKSIVTVGCDFTRSPDSLSVQTEKLFWPWTTNLVCFSPLADTVYVVYGISV